ncbi:MAG TPA: Mbeg1-like protein, partial [Candidatus Gracilibacteria bacterium]
LEDRRRAQWETSHAVDLSTKFTAEQLESYETLKSEWTRTQAAETVTVQKEVVVKVPAQTKSSSKKVKLHPVSVAKEIGKPLEVALNESTYEDYAKVFGEELTAAQSGALVGALAALNLPIEPEMPEGAQDYLELSLKTDKVRNTMETQDKDLRNTVIRRQKLEAQIKSLTTKAMDSYDAWRSTGTNKNYNNYLRYNTELREKKGLLKDLQSYEAELRTTLHTTQDQFNDLQASLGRETTKFARYDNLLTTYKKEQTAYEKRKAEITASVAEKYDYLRAKAQTYYQAAQTTDDEPLVAFIEADLTQDQEEVYIPASEQIVIEAREIPKDLYELSNLVAMGGMGIGGKSSIDTSNPFWTNKVISQFKEGNIDALLLSDLSFDDQKSLLDAAESHRELADILQKEEDEIIELLIRAISKNLNDHPLYFPMRDIAAAVYDLKDQVGTYKKMDPKNYGLLTEDLINTETGFQAAIYSNGENTVVAFAGTQDSKDWDDNIAQSIGLDSAQYKAAKDLAEKIKANLTNQKLIFTGHSLGGGLAALAGASTGATTLTFNAAGIHKKTLDKAEVFNKNFENITNYATRRDILTDIQENINLGPISFLAPNALGKQVKKSGSGLLQYLPSIFSPTPLKIYNGIQQHSNF